MSNEKRITAIHLENCTDVGLYDITMLDVDVGVFAKNVERLRVAGSVVAKSDPTTLVRALLDLGVERVDVAGLGQAVNADAEAGGGVYPRIRAWIESMSNKAAAGMLRVSGEVAATIISQVITQHLGINL